MTSRWFGKRFLLAILAGLIEFLPQTSHADKAGCEQLRACDAIRTCDLQVDTRDCEPHWNCEGLTKVFCEINKGTYKSSCEAAKAAQTAGYAAAKASCETQKSAQKL